MKEKNYLILDNEFIKYCEINNIIDIDKLAKETFNRGFAILKYGESPIIPIQSINKKTVKKLTSSSTIKKIVENPKLDSDLYSE